jgi:hypothetical protein
MASTQPPLYTKPRIPRNCDETPALQQPATHFRRWSRRAVRMDQSCSAESGSLDSLFEKAARTLGSCVGTANRPLNAGQSVSDGGMCWSQAGEAVRKCRRKQPVTLDPATSGSQESCALPRPRPRLRVLLSGNIHIPALLHLHAVYILVTRRSTQSRDRTVTSWPHM